MSPNLFLKLNSSFSFIISFYFIYNYIFRKNHIPYSIIGIMFLYIGMFNIIVLIQKSQPALKKTVLLNNAVFYLLICLLLFKIITNTSTKLYIMWLFLSLFILITNIIGYKMTII